MSKVILEEHLKAAQSDSLRLAGKVPLQDLPLGADPTSSKSASAWHLLCSISAPEMSEADSAIQHAGNPDQWVPLCWTKFYFEAPIQVVEVAPDEEISSKVVRWVDQTLGGIFRRFHLQRFGMNVGQTRRFRSSKSPR